MDALLNDPTIKKLITGLLVVLIILFVVMALSGLKAYGTIGQSVDLNRTISVNGTGEVVAVPDIATISISVDEEGLDIPTAQEEAAKEANTIIEFLEDSGIDEDDIKTTNYSINPQYDYVQEICPVGFRCPGGKQELRGYRISQSIEVKVRKTDEVGAILSGIGELGATNVYGPNFQVEDRDALREEAREVAIKDAREEAERLADALGVRLGDVVNFSDSGFYPYYDRFGFGGDTATLESTKTVPELPVGESTITSNVNIIYEIR
ncbi:hypothetical protein CL654_03095 [bacterium]|nr:hypothetical protein [bacterium]|tara:strand:+ start:4698 stop:5492 length:795 start_codon:yes stop_codon:yes gene_type:complete